MPQTKVLLIDQYEEDRAKLIRCLQNPSRRIDVFEAPSGRVGLDLFRTLVPDCVVLEMKQEDLIGVEVLNLILAELQGRPVPVFVWTCLMHDMLRSAATTLGINGYFTKQPGNECLLAKAILEATGNV